MKVCYLRISTTNQSLDRQELNLKEKLGEDVRVIEDRGISGTMEFENRSGGSYLMKLVEEGTVDEIHVWELSRLGRSLKNILQTLDFFGDRKVQVVIHKENLRLLDENGERNPVVQLMINLLGSISQWERELTRIRCLEGIEISKRLGKYRGRKLGSVEGDRFWSKPKTKKVVELLEEDYPINYISKIVPCSRNLVYKIKNLQEEGLQTV